MTGGYSGADAPCREVRRINVSAAFFISVEFQETGFLAERMDKVAYGDATSPDVPASVPVIRFNEFLADTQEIGRGIIVGQVNWENRLEANKQALALEFVQRPRFTALYPSVMTAAQFVDQLAQNAGLTLTQSERDQLTAILGSTPSDTSKRAQVLRAMADDSRLRQAEFNRAFVLMEYFGYLRRNPDDAPEKDLNFAGWRFWLDKLEQEAKGRGAAGLLKEFDDHRVGGRVQTVVRCCSRSLARTMPCDTSPAAPGLSPRADRCAEYSCCLPDRRS